MSVIVKGMQMPKSCMECPLFSGAGCKATMKMFNEVTNVAVRVKGCPLDKMQKIDETKTYEKGLVDAWEATKKIILSYKDYSALKPTDFKEVFGIVDVSEVLENFTAAEVIAKIKKYEKQQAINVGDEVYFVSECKGVLICKDDKSYTILWDDESVSGYDKQKQRAIELKKTGRHFPQVDEMLKAMKE